MFQLIGFRVLLDRLTDCVKQYHPHPKAGPINHQLYIDTLNALIGSVSEHIQYDSIARKKHFRKLQAHLGRFGGIITEREAAKVERLLVLDSRDEEIQMLATPAVSHSVILEGWTQEEFLYTHLNFLIQLYTEFSRDLLVNFSKKIKSKELFLEKLAKEIWTCLNALLIKVRYEKAGQENKLDEFSKELILSIKTIFLSELNEYGSEVCIPCGFKVRNAGEVAGGHSTYLIIENQMSAEVGIEIHNVGYGNEDHSDVLCIQKEGKIYSIANKPELIGAVNLKDDKESNELQKYITAVCKARSDIDSVAVPILMNRNIDNKFAFRAPRKKEWPFYIERQIIDNCVVENFLIRVKYKFREKEGLIFEEMQESEKAFSAQEYVILNDMSGSDREDLENLKINRFQWSIQNKPILELIKKSWKDWSQENSVSQVLYYYIDSDCSSMADFGDREESHKKIDAYLKNDRRKILLILGDSGSGKTSLTLKIMRDFWEHETKFLDYIPLRIELRALSGEYLKNSFENILKNQYKLSDTEITVLKEMPILLILDGFDELSSNKKNKFCREIGLKSWKRLKCIITSRRQYFGKDEEFKECFLLTDALGEGIERSFEMIYLTPFNRKQVEKYLNSYSDTYQPVSGESSFNLSLLNQLLNQENKLEKILSNPFILKIFTTIWPELSIDEYQDLKSLRIITIYEKFLKYWFNKAEEKLEQSSQYANLNLSGERLKVYFYNYAMELAYYFFTQGKTELLYGENLKNNRYEKTSMMLENFFDKEDIKQNIAKEACPIKRTGIEVYSFIHKSLQDYLAARYFYVSMVSKNMEIQYQKIWNNRFLTQESDRAVLVFVAEIIERSQHREQIEKDLLSMVWYSAQDSTREIAASNAMSILNWNRYNFSGIDFSNVKIPYADLSWAICHRTIFRNANLNRANFYHAFLDEADITNADLKDLYIDDDSGRFIPYYNGATMSSDGTCIIVREEKDYLYKFNSNMVAEKFNINFLNGLDISEITFSPDNSQLLICVKNNRPKYKWFDLELNKLIINLPDTVDAAIFSRDGKILFAYNKSNTIKSVVYWYSCKQKSLLQMMELKSGIEKISFSPNDKYVFFWRGDYDNIYCYEIKTQIQKKMAQLSGKTSKIIFSLSSEHVLFICRVGNETIVDWFSLEALENRIIYFQDRVVEAFFSPDSKYLFICEASKVLVYDCQTRSQITKYDCKCNNAVFFPDSRHVVFFSRNEEAFFYEICPPYLLKGTQKNVNQILFSKDGYQFVLYKSDKFEKAYWYSIKSFEPLEEFDSINEVIISDDSREILLVAKDHFFIVSTDVNLHPTISKFDLSITNAGYNKNQKLIFSSGECCYVWERDKKDYYIVYRSLEKIKSIFHHSLQGSFICVMESNKAFWCTNIPTSKMQPIEKHPNMQIGHLSCINKVSILNNALICTIGNDGANIWGIKKREIENYFKIKSGVSHYLSGDLSHIIFVNSESFDSSLDKVYIYDTESKSLTQLDMDIDLDIFSYFLSRDTYKSIYEKKTFDKINLIYKSIIHERINREQFVISPDKKYIIFYSKNSYHTCIFNLFDFESGLLILTIQLKNEKVDFSADSRHLIFYGSVGFDYCYGAIYKIYTKEQFSLDYSIRKVVFSPIGSTAILYTEGYSKNLFWFDLNLNQILIELKDNFDDVLFFENGQQVIFYSKYASYSSLWYNTLTQELLKKIDFPIWKINFSPDIKTIIFDPEFSDNFVYYYDIKNQELIAKLPKSIFPLNAEELLLLEDINNCLKVSKYHANKADKPLLVLNISLLNVSYKPSLFIDAAIFLKNDTELLIISGYMLHWIDCSTEKLLSEIVIIGNKIFVTSDNKYCIVYGHRSIYVYETLSRNQIIQIDDQSNINMIRVIQDRYALFHGESIFIIDLLDNRVGKLEYAANFVDFYESLEYQDSGQGDLSNHKLITTGKDDATLRLWSLANIEKPSLMWSTAEMSFSSRNIKGLETAKNLSKLNCSFFSSKPTLTSTSIVVDDFQLL